MSSRRLLPALLIALLTACNGSAPAADADGLSDPSVRAHFERARAAISGERAFETVAFVAPHWRVPGNAGFDASIRHVAGLLEEAGYVLEDDAPPGAPLTYRLERRPMERPTWEPVDASLAIVGEDEPVLRMEANRNMLAMYSYSTPEDGVEAELVDVGAGRPEDFEDVDVAGKVVFGETYVGRLFAEAVQQRGALGVLAYNLPDYVRPEVHRNSIQFGSIPLDPDRQAWGMPLSHEARARLKAALEDGPVRVRVVTETRLYESEELTLVAEARGGAYPGERFVFSAHVQEPGANDNASGVGALAEIAVATAALVRAGELAPERTITFLWGDEITSTRRYVTEDSARAGGIRWGMSLDMVGEDTEKTGGTFLIEKMPDPSAVWTRGDDRHTEWGGRPLSEDELTPHYFNDFVLARCLDQAEATGWVVRTNPFEGGSDHVPFLRAGIPGLLLWHFTDVFYHTDNDRIDKVSPQTLENVSVCAAVTAWTLASAGGETARFVVAEVERAALDRLAAERVLSEEAVAAGADPAEEQHILDTWAAWYADALRAADDLETGGTSPETAARIEEAVQRVLDFPRALP